MILSLQDRTAEADRSVLLRYLDQAYQELYDTFDLSGAVTDEFFEIDGTDGQIVLPEYVDQIRGAGARELRVPITVSDFRTGYRVTPQYQRPFEWRVRRRVPLSSQMDATDQLRVTLAAAESQSVQVFITGQTPYASSTTETITFPAGTTSVVTTNQFIADNPYALTNVSKDIPTINDVVVYVNSTGTEVSRIRNKLLRAEYVLLQLTDINPPSNPFVPPTAGAQICYKLTRSPLYYDTDNIIDPRLEDSVVWKARELWYMGQKGEEAALEVKKSYEKCISVLNNVMINMESSAEKKLKVGRDRFAAAWVYSRNPRYGRYYYR